MNWEKLNQCIFVWLCTEHIAPAILEYDADLAATFNAVTTETDRHTIDLAIALDLGLDLVPDLTRALDRARALAIAIAPYLGTGIDLKSQYADKYIELYEREGGNLDDLFVQDLDKTILSRLDDGESALDTSQYHTCETTHCRAGWAIVLAPGGRELERMVGSWTAGAMIYRVSRPGVPVPDFYTSNEDTLADMRRFVR